MKAKEFGNFLRNLRKERNLTIRQIEAFSGVSNSYLSLVENGKRGIPSPDMLAKLAPVLKIPYMELMTAAGYLEHDGSDAYTQAVSLLDEIDREIKIAKESGIDIDRATAQMLVEHRRRILAGEEGSIDYIYQAETLGDALLRIAELDYEYDFDEETFAKLVIKAREKYGLPSVGGPESAGHSSDHLSPGIFEAGNPAFNCIHEDKLEYNDKENAALKPKQQKPSYEEHVLSAKTLADASIRIADLFNDYQIDEDEYLRLNTLAYRKFGLPPAPGAEQAAHTKHNIPGTGVFENDKKD